MKSVMIYANNSFVCSRQTSDYGSERALNRAEASGGKSDEISNYRFSGGRWAKLSNRDIFGGVVWISPFLRDFGNFFPRRKLQEIVGYFTQILLEISCFLPRKNVPIGRYFHLLTNTVLNN